jgi:hypothetical protein
MWGRNAVGVERDLVRQESRYVRAGSSIGCVQIDRGAGHDTSAAVRLNQGEPMCSQSLIKTIRGFLASNPTKTVQVTAVYNNAVYDTGFLQQKDVLRVGGTGMLWDGSFETAYMRGDVEGHDLRPLSVIINIADVANIFMAGGGQNDCLFEAVAAGSNRECGEEWIRELRGRSGIEGPVEARVADGIFADTDMSVDIYCPMTFQPVILAEKMREKHVSIILGDGHYYYVGSPQESDYAPQAVVDSEPRQLCAHGKISPGRYAILSQKGAYKEGSYEAINAIAARFSAHYVKKIDAENPIGSLREALGVVLEQQKSLLATIGFNIARLHAVRPSTIALGIWKTLFHPKPKFRHPSMVESFILATALNGGLQHVVKGFEGEALDVDYTSFYPGIMQSRYRVPISNGQIIDKERAEEVLSIVASWKQRKPEHEDFPVGLLALDSPDMEEKTFMKRKIYYTTQEVLHGVRKGVTWSVRDDMRHLVWPKDATARLCDIFGDYVHKIFALKKAADGDEQKRKAIKLVLNSLWGACTEKSKCRRSFTPEGGLLEDDGVFISTTIIPDMRNPGRTKNNTKCRPREQPIFLSSACYVGPFITGIGRQMASSLLCYTKSNFPSLIVAQWHTDGGWLAADDMQALLEFYVKQQADKMSARIDGGAVPGGIKHIRVHHVNKVEVL